MQYRGRISRSVLAPALLATFYISGCGKAEPKYVKSGETVDTERFVNAVDYSDFNRDGIRDTLQIHGDEIRVCMRDASSIGCTSTETLFRSDLGGGKIPIRAKFEEAGKNSPAVLVEYSDNTSDNTIVAYRAK